jgi:ATP-dependent RNA helicase SUPV3L1/SUV3
VLAVLGPTNTGKTHFAVERLLGHASGVIGLPLRLLAREIYERAANAKGRSKVALVTGEEKIVPARANWFVCTVEAMPLERDFDFVAVDEIQLCADAERGHIFTDRLLGARGGQETMFLGAETVRGLIRRLVPEAEFITRPRFSKLAYAGAKKLSRLAPRTGIVAFSANEVYAIAEQVRRQRGGAAVVLGALSPRTRNAQVALYQNGDVDYLVATDAIGMGLNLDLDHVAFAGLRKFDGHCIRPLRAAELGQIAGRAGRFMADGSFGTTAEAEALAPETIARIESHRFEPIPALCWRNAELDFASIEALIRSLEAPAPADCLVRGREAIDCLTLKALRRDPETRRLAQGRRLVQLLWRVCQIPDFRQTLDDSHVRLVGRIYRHLAVAEGVLPTDWVASQISHLNRVDGDIDTLSARIAAIRTWTFVSYRADWLKDAAHWQERTRAIEDKLSDALHAGLTQRFVDRRSAFLVRRLKSASELEAVLAADGDVLVEGHVIGRLNGLRFLADTSPGERHRAMRAAANRTLGRIIEARVRELLAADDDVFDVRGDGRLRWRSEAIAELLPGPDPLRPRLRVLDQNFLNEAARERIKRKLTSWLERLISRQLRPLERIGVLKTSGPVAGLAFQLREALGAIPRGQALVTLGRLDKPGRLRLQKLGVRFGQAWIYMPKLMNENATRLKALLWGIFRGLPEHAFAQGFGVQPTAGRPADWWQACNFAVIGPHAVPIKDLERLARLARKDAEKGSFALTPAMIRACGLAPPIARQSLLALGYEARPGDGDEIFTYRQRRSSQKGRAVTKQGNRHSPFAPLQEIIRR